MPMTLGRFLQILGMVVLPVGLFYGISQGSMAVELTSLITGALLFIAGRTLDGVKRSDS